MGSCWGSVHPYELRKGEDQVCEWVCEPHCKELIKFMALFLVCVPFCFLFSWVIGDRTSNNQNVTCDVKH